MNCTSQGCLKYPHREPLRRSLHVLTIIVFLIVANGCGIPRPLLSSATTGAAGAVGATGQQGPSGPAGPAGITYKAAWQANASYVPNDSVSFAGSTFLAQQTNSAMQPDKYPAIWSILALAGSAGADGQAGVIGQAGQAGQAGSTGTAGSTGAAGIAGPIGPAGAPGLAGTAATIAIGTVSTVGSAMQATVSNSGTASAAIFNFALPQGVSGSTAAAANIAAPLMRALGVVNLFDFSSITPDTTLNADGTLVPLSANSGLYTSDFMVCSGLSSVSFNANAGHGVAFYDAGQNLVQFVPPGLVSAAVPQNATFFRFSTSGDPSTFVVVAGPSANIPATYLPYGAVNAAVVEALAQVPRSLGPLAGKNLGVLGDSIVAATGDTWMPTVQKRTNATFTWVDGVGGRETRFAFSNYNNGAAIPGDGSGTSAAGHTLAQDLSSIDLLLIELGTNDGGQFNSSNLGTATDAPSMNPSATLSASIAGVITTILAAKPTVRILWMSPWLDNPTNGHGGCSTVACSTAVTNTILQTCAGYAIPVINMMTESGINSRTWSTYLVDGLHPSQVGGEKVIGPLVGQKMNLYF